MRWLDSHRRLETQEAFELMTQDSVDLTLYRLLISRFRFPRQDLKNEVVGLTSQARDAFGASKFTCGN
jgi:hypothetical protein